MNYVYMCCVCDHIWNQSMSYFADSELSERGLNAPTKAAPNILLFHSSATQLPTSSPFHPDAPRDLSNFAPFDVVIDNVVYPTVEHAFQAMKYTCTSRPELAETVRQASTATAAKRAGSRKAMKQHKVELDISCWNAKKEHIMRELIQSKISRHPKIQAIMETARQHPVKFVHFSRFDMEWGAHVKNGAVEGRNLLGTIYQEFV